jgi:hypothetical protein
MRQGPNNLLEWKLAYMEKIDSLLNLFSAYH